jgi:hypothetical protein
VEEKQGVPAFLNKTRGKELCGVRNAAEHRESTVAWPDQLAEQTRQKHIRAGSRLNSRVELTVEWQESGRTFQASGYTVDISAKGCQAIVEQGLLIGQKLRLINRANGNSTGAKIIWKGHEGRKGWELGLELEDGSGEFWDVEF